MVEASVTKLSSKGQVVIPINVRKAVGFKEGERLLAIALGDMVVLKRIIDKTFEEVVKPVWKRVREMGLTEENIDVLIREAEAQSSP